MIDLKSRAQQAAVRYLEIRGYEIIDEQDGFCGIVAMDADDDVIVFVHVDVRDGRTDEEDDTFVSESSTYAKKFEREAALWFVENPTKENCYGVRFDVISMCVTSDDKALLRHHINAAKEAEAVCGDDMTFSAEKIAQKYAEYVGETNLTKARREAVADFMKYLLG